MITKAMGPKRHDPVHANRVATVSVRVRDLAQLFNSLDASPFWDRDLDPQAAEFIEEEFSDKRSAAEWHLHVHAASGAALAADLQPALEHYYERMAHSAALRLREETRLGEIALLGGIGIFLIAMSAREFIARFAHQELSGLLNEGLIILAWLALWRPVESLVYGWVPHYRRRRLYQRLAAIRVTVRLEEPRLAQTATARPARGNPDATWTLRSLLREPMMHQALNLRSDGRSMTRAAHAAPTLKTGERTHA